MKQRAPNIQEQVVHNLTLRDQDDSRRVAEGPGPPLPDLTATLAE